jgi:cation transporter-like permease
MSLNNPDSRRALRSIVQAVVALVLVGFIGWLIYLLAAEPKALLKIAMSLCIIVGLGTLLYGAENVTRSVKFKIGPAEGGIGDDA